MSSSQPPQISGVAAIPARAVHALQEFLRLEAASGILLIAATVVAMVMANSPLEGLYQHFQDLPVQVRVGALDLDKPLLLWINDGLMAIFFLLVALEIKREIISGQLSSRSQLLLPLVCAVGGMAVPALFYVMLDHAQPEAMRGWAIPTATDIAFSLGILSLVGSRVPVAMRLLLSTIAVVDDLGAILVIAFFYTGSLNFAALGWAVVAVLVMVVLNRRKVTALTPYMLLGVVAWVCLLKSGVHATLAGVITGLMIPHYERGNDIDDAVEHSPLETLEHALHPWVAYLILPLFAFVNAGLMMSGIKASDFVQAVPLGVILGLVLGKPIGICVTAWLCHSTGLSRLPEGVTLKSLPGLGMLCGIGFTMSLFIASLAFGEGSEHFDQAVLGVLCGSLVSALLGFAWLRWTLPTPAVIAPKPTPAP